MKRFARFVFCISLFFSTSFSQSISKILKVPSEQYPTIQSAVDSATDSCTVLVALGEYTEAITIPEGLNIEICSEQGAYRTIVQNPEGTVFTMRGPSKIIGFTIKPKRVGVYFGNPYAGGGVVRECVIHKGFQNGILLSHTHHIVKHNLIRGNDVGVTMVCGSQALVYNNLIIENDTGVMATPDCGINFEGVICGNTIAYNYQNGILLNSNGSAGEQNYIKIRNNVIVQNLNGISSDQLFDTYLIEYNNVWNNVEQNYVNCYPNGNLNIYCNPLFIKGTEDSFFPKCSYQYCYEQFYLQQDNVTSPCVDAGTDSVLKKGELNAHNPDNNLDLDYYKDLSYGNDPNLTTHTKLNQDAGPWDIGFHYQRFQFIDVGEYGFVSLPKEIALQQNYPNPFNSQTIISYQLPDKASVTLEIYDVLGQEVRTLVNENQSAGYHSVVWNGRDNLGRLVSSGVYFYQLKMGKKF